MALRGVQQGTSRRVWWQCSYVAGSKEVSLAEELAFLVHEVEEKRLQRDPVPIKPLSRTDTARLLQLRVKKLVKEQQQPDGKFHCLLHNVVANPKTLNDAYHSILVESNILYKKTQQEEQHRHAFFTSLSQEVATGVFDVKANTAPVSAMPGALVLPILKLRIVQEAVRMALEVVFRPSFSKFSHGGRSNRGHTSALHYIRKEVKEPDWWFAIPLNKKADHLVLNNLLSFISDHVNDPPLFSFIQSLFDNGVLNLDFGGGFLKGQGLPQEGALSPLFTNIYLAPFDQEFFRFSLRFEALDQSSGGLRAWFLRQLKRPSTSSSSENPCVRVYYCRHFDEMFFAVSGSAEVAHKLKSETERFLVDVLHLEFDGGGIKILSCKEGEGVRFLGTMIRRREKEAGTVRVVHKLRDKVELFASQKQDAWDAVTLRMGKKWVAHGVRKTKEDGGLDAINKHMNVKNQEESSSSLLTRVSFSLRKPGMLTLHWYKHLLKIWLTHKKKKNMLPLKPNTAYSENVLLRKQIIEPSLPRELLHSFYQFQHQVTAYLNSETESLQRIMPVSMEGVCVTEVLAPIEEMRKNLRRYGVVGGREGHPVACYQMSLQKEEEIIRWFEGIGRRWMRLYDKCDNKGEVVRIVAESVRRSCIMTLAEKLKVREGEAEKKLEMELTGIPRSEDVMDGGMTATQEGEMWNGGGPWLLLMRRRRTPLGCSVVGCEEMAPCVYKLRGGGGGAGSGVVHSSLCGMELGLCGEHVKDLYMGRISLASVDFVSRPVVN